MCYFYLFGNQKGGLIMKTFKVTVGILLLLKQLRWFVFAAGVVTACFRATDKIEILLMVWLWHFAVILVPSGIAGIWREEDIAERRSLLALLFLACFLNLSFEYIRQSIHAPYNIAIEGIAVILIVNIFFNFAINADFNVWRDR
jgi:hypothetical protein